MKERLHSLTADLHRRTGEMRSQVRRPPTPEEPSGLETGEEIQPSSQPLEPALEAALEVEGWRWAFPRALEPHSRGYLAWLCVLSFAFLYNAYAIPLRSAYPYQTDINLHRWLLADYLTDLLFLLDLLLVKPRLVFIKAGLTIVLVFLAVLLFKTRVPSRETPERCDVATSSVLT
jgi:hypothetical protein